MVMFYMGSEVMFSGNQERIEVTSSNDNVSRLDVLS